MAERNANVPGAENPTELNNLSKGDIKKSAAGFPRRPFYQLNLSGF